MGERTTASILSKIFNIVVLSARFGGASECPGFECHYDISFPSREVNNNKTIFKRRFCTNLP